MAGKHDVEYWDTCVFLAYLKEEQHRAGEYEEIESQIRRFEMGGLVLATSTITITEMYQASRFTSQQQSLLDGWFKRSNFYFVDANQSVCKLASDIRSDFKENSESLGFKGAYPTTPDAIQVASAIALKQVYSGVINLITLDSNTKPSAKELALTDMAVEIKKKYGVNICRPLVPSIFIESTLEEA